MAYVITRSKGTMQNAQQPSDETSWTHSWRSAGLAAVRYGIGGMMMLGGVVLLVVVGGDLGAYGFASAVGAGLSVMLLNLLYRIGVSGDYDREREEEARKHFDAHGVWPDDEAAPDAMPDAGGHSHTAWGPQRREPGPARRRGARDHVAH
jgi:hypothetical protein